MGSPEALAIVQRALDSGASGTVLQELIGLRDEKVVPLLCPLIARSSPRGELVGLHTQIIETLGTLGSHRESIQTLRTVLHRGEWWAPYRTAGQRSAAAAALRRIGTQEAIAVLEEAAHTGSRGVRNAARMHMRTPVSRERQHT
jgi:HEAT repeat protein